MVLKLQYTFIYKGLNIFHNKGFIEEASIVQYTFIYKGLHIFQNKGFIEEASIVIQSKWNRMYK